MSVWHIRCALAGLGLLPFIGACGADDTGTSTPTRPTGKSSTGAPAEQSAAQKHPGKDGWGLPVTASYPATTSDVSSCLTFTLPDDQWRWGLYGYWTGEGLAIWMDKSVFPKHEQPSFLIVKFLNGDRNWGSDPQEIKPGAIAFGPNAGAAASVKTCESCPILHTDVWGDNPTAVWYPVSGTLTFEQANAATQEYVGSLKNVVFRRVGINGMKDYGDWISGPDPVHPEQPPCAYLAETHFDTRRVAGRTCKTSDDCPNGNFHVCDPDSNTCVESQCDTGERWDGATGKMIATTSSCPDGRVCQLVVDHDTWYYGAHIEHAFSTGRCLRSCDPAASSCPAPLTCQETDKVVKQPTAHVCQQPLCPKSDLASAYSTGTGPADAGVSLSPMLLPLP